MALTDVKVKTLDNIVLAASVIEDWTLVNDFAGTLMSIHVQSSLNQNFVVGFSTSATVEPDNISITCLLGSATNVRDFVLDFEANSRRVPGFIWVKNLGTTPTTGFLVMNYVVE